MNITLIIISALLGVFGVLFNLTHDYPKLDGESDTQKPRLLKSLNWVGGVVIALIICSSIVSIYLSYSTKKENDKLTQENLYLELSDHYVGPQYIFNANLRSDILSKKPGEAELNFFDIKSRTDLFPNLIDTSNYTAISIKHGNISFSLVAKGNGHVHNYLFLENYDSYLFSTDNSLKMPVKGNGYFDYSANNLSCNGQLDTLIRAGTVYGRVLKDYRENKNPSFVKLFFREKPNERMIKKSFQKIGDIENMTIAFSFDIDAIRWFILLLELENDYSFQKNGNWWELTVALVLKELPEITDLYDSNKVQFDMK